MHRPLLLHIGRHKTGSTSLQAWLADAAPVLRERGFQVITRQDYAAASRVTPTRRLQTNLYDLTQMFARPGLISGPRVRGEAPRLSRDEKLDAAQAVNACLHAQPGGTLIMSSEGFSILRTPEEGEPVRALFDGFDLRVMMIDRERESWIRSYRQTLAFLDAHRPADGDLAGTIFDFGPDSPHFDLSGLHAIFPDIDMFQYEDLMARDGSTVPCFLRWAGIDPDGLPPLDVWKRRTVYPDGV